MKILELINLLNNVAKKEGNIDCFGMDEDENESGNIDICVMYDRERKKNTVMISIDKEVIKKPLFDEDGEKSDFQAMYESDCYERARDMKNSF